MKRIKTIILALAMALIMAPAAVAAEVTLAWDPNSESDLAGYKLHWGTDTRVYTTSVDVGNVTQYTLTNIPDGTVYYAATAYDTDGNESDYSDELVYNIIPNAPTGLRIIP